MSFNTYKEMAYKISRFIPWSYGGTLRKNLVEGTVLDLGCGEGWAWRCFFDKNRRARFYSFGVDFSSEYIEYCIDHQVYNQVICQDLTKFEFIHKSFDVVLLIQILAHLEKRDGLILLEKAEYVARKQVIIATENGIVDLPEREHISEWKPEEFQNRGYIVKGFGIKPIGLNSKCANFFENLSRITTIIPFTLNRPNAALQLIAIKNLD